MNGSLFAGAESKVLAVLLALLCAPLHASPNLLANGDFDDDLVPWQWFATGCQLDADANACTNSHAISCISAGDPKLDQQDLQVTQCVVLSQPPPAVLHARIAYRADVGSVVGNLRFYSNEFCSNGSKISETSTALANGAGEWIESTFSSAVPGTTQSVAFELSLVSSGFLFSARADAAVLLAGDSVFMDDFEVGEPCRWISFP